MGNREAAGDLDSTERTLKTGSKGGCWSYRLRAFRRDRSAPPSALTPLERGAARVQGRRVARETERGGCVRCRRCRQRYSHFANALRNKHQHWSDALTIDEPGVFPEASRLRPSILIRGSGEQPVVIETEFEPASSVEDDARGRVGLVPAFASDPIKRVIAVSLSHPLRRDQASLPVQTDGADFGYCAISGDPCAPVRWPAGGWLTGGIDDIALCIEHAMVSQHLIDEGISILERDIRVATRIVKDTKLYCCGVIEQHMGPVLNERNGGQAARMAMTLIANALTFHASIVGPHDIPSVSQIQAQRLGPLQGTVLDTWQKTLAEVHYWPIFGVASDLLAPVRVQDADRILDPLVQAANQLADLGVKGRHDLSGRMFLATFYTVPTSTTLLAELAAPRLDTDRSDLLGNKRLSIADFSCGTGTLLSAAHHAVLTRFRQVDGDDSETHRHMIEHSIIGTDIATPDGQRSRRSPSETVCRCRSS